ncbi:unnamed protein product [Adineta steineri]|uniref:SKICH domain-containing protein n=1 Tax=Adineta steineri TaxID=433720 RepID=A0A818RD75_9BILA|nr:unnamed protein product [Adineta steineri]CAF3652416.1 unnamed protein product [Adineta steineri]
MSEINDQCSDTSSDLNWPIDHPMERQSQQHDRVIFENVPDQYVKGEDVTAFFSIVSDIKVNPNEDQIGLLRVGSTNIKECLAYAPVQFNPSTTSGSTGHGIAIFPSSSLPVTDDEFYQFCYIINKTKNLGSSIPFQLNCALDDIDLLSNLPVGKTNPDGLIALADHDNDELVVIHTKRMLTEEKLRQENRQLLDRNRRLESQKDECEEKLELLEIKTKEHMDKINNDMQTLTASHKTAIDELSSRQQLETNLRSQFDACQSLCAQYKADSLQHAQRCQTLENGRTQLETEANQLRSRLAVTTQLVQDQATQITGLERQLMQSNESALTSSQRHAMLEQQMHEILITAEKHQKTIEAQLNAYSKQVAQQTEHIERLENTNDLLQEELASIKADNEHLKTISKHDNDLTDGLQQQLDLVLIENESTKNEMESLRNQLDEMNAQQQAYASVTNSFEAIKTRCVKHQKSEIEAKRQLGVYKQFINDLQREIQELTERLAAGAEEYKTLSRKYAMLGRTKEMDQSYITTTVNEPVQQQEESVPSLFNTYEHRQNEPLLQASLVDIDGEVSACPMCYWEFPENMTFDAKKLHIDHHFA